MLVANYNIHFGSLAAAAAHHTELDEIHHPEATSSFSTTGALKDAKRLLLNQGYWGGKNAYPKWQGSTRADLRPSPRSESSHMANTGSIRSTPLFGFSPGERIGFTFLARLPPGTRTGANVLKLSSERSATEVIMWRGGVRVPPCTLLCS